MINLAQFSGGKDSTAMLLCSDCRRWLPHSAFHPRRDRKRGFQHKCKECQATLGKQYKTKRRALGLVPYETRSQRALKAEVIAWYGNKCACCMESRIEFLSIDHINGGGRRHRAELWRDKRRSIYRELRLTGFPAGYRVLCHNCNQAMGAFGYCPHQREEAVG